MVSRIMAIQDVHTQISITCENISLNDKKRVKVAGEIKVAIQLILNYPGLPNRPNIITGVLRCRKGGRRVRGRCDYGRKAQKYAMLPHLKMEMGHHLSQWAPSTSWIGHGHRFFFLEPLEGCIATLNP